MLLVVYGAFCLVCWMLFCVVDRCLSFVVWCWLRVVWCLCSRSRCLLVVALVDCCYVLVFVVVRRSLPSFVVCCLAIGLSIDCFDGVVLMVFVCLLCGVVRCRC